MSNAAPVSVSQEGSNFDETFMQQSLLFSDSLKDLKNLRTQLYSAAEYFELSYENDEQRQIVVETLKDYTVKALVNTVDHLGSFSYKVNDFLDEKAEEVSGTELRVSSIEQRLRTCHDYIDRQGHSQQSLVINTPKYHKHYTLPDGKSMRKAIPSKLKHIQSDLHGDDARIQFMNAFRPTPREVPASTVRKGLPPSASQRPPKAAPSPSSRPPQIAPSPYPQPPQRSATFSSASKTEPEKRAASPIRFPLVRSSSVRPTSSSRPTSPKKNRSTTPNRYPPLPRKSASMHGGVRVEKEIEQPPSKNKIFSRRCLVGVNLKRTTRYIHIWMNTDELNST